MMQRSFLSTVILGLTILLLCSTLGFAESNAVMRRAAFDIGSVTIKCTVADVDVVSGDIVKVIDTFSRKVDFAEDMARSYDENFSKDIMALGQTAIIEMKEEGLKLGAREFSGVGGNLFRQARNGRAYFATLEKETGVACRILSKQQGAMLSYHAVRLQNELPTGSLLVWDIGGSTLTMTARAKDGSLQFYIDKLASVSFKNAIIASIQNKDINTTSTPNPVSEAEVQDGLEFAQSHALLNVTPELAGRLRSGTVEVIGIGGVHNYSVPELLGGRTGPYSRQDVKEVLKKWTGKEDEAFESEYASTRLTNLILVLGYMNAMDIETITPLKVNQTMGLLVSPEFW